MTLLETSYKYRADSEEEAKQLMEGLRADAAKDGISIKKMNCEHKEKKSKGEVVAEVWVVSVVQTNCGLWEDLL